MSTSRYDFKTVLADSLKVSWQIEDLIGGEKALDFSQPFLPEALAGTGPIGCLSAAERLKLNQIRGHSYLRLFAFAESFIIPFALDRAREAVHAEDLPALRALTNFADEEAKHQQLFQRFAQEFTRGFGVECGVVGPFGELARTVLQRPPLAVALLALHIEWMTQRHFLDAVRSGEPIDPRFNDLLRHHWMEEAQHAKIDVLVIQAMASKLSATEVESGVDEYLGLCAILDELLAAQVKLDLESLSRALGRALTAEQQHEISRAQLKSYRWAFLASGMMHPNVVALLGELSPKAQARVAERAATYC